ncbi:RNA methyltransferase [Alteribacter natronophilus]|nr:RNA methyltransferase [Alteribacter natronophilus]
MEMRAFFNTDTTGHILNSPREVDPQRSPFIKERVAVLKRESSIEKLEQFAASLSPTGRTFRIEVLNVQGLQTFSFQERKELERRIGLHMKDQADLRSPDRIFGIVYYNDMWYFGGIRRGKSPWLAHQKRPHGYSTALNARVARTIANIAVPDRDGVKVIDPCCGIGTVLLEACSMGIDIRGSDRNPKVMNGSRKNLAHFGYFPDVKLQDIADVSGKFDAAIIDMPYNLCSVMSPEDQEHILKHARRFAERCVIVTIDPADQAVKQAGFTITDRCKFFKNGSFSREVLSCT